MGCHCSKAAGPQKAEAVGKPGVTLLSTLGTVETLATVSTQKSDRSSRPTRTGRVTQVIGKALPQTPASSAGGVALPPKVVEDLSAYKKVKEMAADTRELIRSSMRQNRLTALLEDEEIDIVLETMEYLEFEADDVVVKQGEVGNTFFVVEDGLLSVSVNGNVSNTLTRGSCFGGLALLYQCPRTASVTATTSTGCWGASGSTFQTVLRENAQRRHSENRKFLDSIQLFDGLPGKQKDCIAGGVFVERMDAGTRVATEGEAAAAIYFAKHGDLRVCSGGRVAATGELLGGRSRKLQPGECFGEQEVLKGEPYSATIVADGSCELLCISAKHLGEVLGQDPRAALEKALLLSAVRKSPVMSKFSPAQQDAIVGAMQIHTFAKGQKISEKLRFAVVMEGSIMETAGGSLRPGAEPLAVGRGDWYEEDALSSHSPGRKVSSASSSSGSSSSGSSSGRAAKVARVAGATGCRLAVLRKEGFADALAKSGLAVGQNPGQAIDLPRKMFVIRKVHAFRHLSHEQTDMVAQSLVSQNYRQGSVIVKQGEIGTAFYVIASGEVRVAIDGKVIRTMGKNNCFGERALLFNEGRSATIDVVSKEAEIWSLEKAVFSQIVKGKMQQQLIERIKLQDTSVTLKDLVHVKFIGAGASGTVRLVEHNVTHTRYALKRVHKKRGKIPEEVQRERDLLAENDHPFIQTYVKTLETHDSVYMLTELITGGELHAAIRTIPTVLSRAQAQFYTGSLVVVLEELAGRSIVYRDLKPENVMLDAQGYLKLVDFGIGKKLRDGTLRTFTVVGTPHYMAPEVLHGRGYGLEVDIWSLGVLLFELVCGYLPFADDKDSPTEVCQAVLRETLTFPTRYRDSAGKSLITGLLRRNPMERLGAGISGYEDIKAAQFFRIGHGDTSLFDKIVGRELDPPVIPKGETYSDPEQLVGIRQDDADQLFGSKK